MNLYRYCHDDPVDNSDPTGMTIIPFSKEVEPLWKEAKAELRRDPEQRKIIDRLERPDIKVRVWLTKEKITRAVFDPQIGVKWNPHMAYKSKGTESRLSPAMALGHELDHILQAYIHPEQYRVEHDQPDRQYFRVEERRVITGSEASMFNTFFKEKPRQNYNVVPYPVSDPLGR